MNNETIIGQHWSNVTKEKRYTHLKLRWWQSPLIIKHINKLVCGEYVEGFSQGIINKTKSKFINQLPFNKGISVGCGTGFKEINLLKQKIVNYFDLFELSDERIKIGIKTAKQYGVEDKLNFIKGNAFEIIKEFDSYDFVHWNNSLHHMLNVFEAVEWSRNILKNNGVFYMDDYVGPSRFQWTDKTLSFVSSVRNNFKNTKYLINPKNNKSFISINVERPTINKMIESDPSEAADSSKILDAINYYFKNAEIIKTGGIIYFLTLNDIINNFDEKNSEDKLLLELLMKIDHMSIETYDSLYAVALAVK